MLDNVTRKRIEELIKLNKEIDRVFPREVQELIRRGFVGYGSPDPKPVTKPTHPGVAVRAAREKLQWSQENLEEVSGVARRTICDLELGKRKPKPATLQKIMEALQRGMELLKT